MSTKPNAFLNEVIWTFAGPDGAIPLCRGDAFGLYKEAGWTAKEADVMAFGPYGRKAMGETPWTAADARANLIADGTIEQVALAA